MKTQPQADDMIAPITEGIVEQAALNWLSDVGYSYLHGPNTAPDEPAAGRGYLFRCLLTQPI